MADSIKKSAKLRKSGGLLTPKEFKGQLKKGRQDVETPFRRGTSSQQRNAATAQKQQIEKQQQTELLRRVESEDEIAQRKALASSKGAGRRSLIKTSPTGLAQTLGG